MNEEYLNRMKSILKDKYDLYINALKEEPLRSIRLNNINYDTFIKNIDMDLEKIEYDIDGYYLKNDKKYGNHPYHHLGAFYFQEPSAMMPVNLYDFKGDELVLDLCASPGGKSSQIARRIPNGVLVSNEIDKERSNVLFQNLERMSLSNVYITNNSSFELAKTFPNTFDVILVDAPCSGEGMMRKDETARNMWSLENVNLCHNRDIEILNNADKMLKRGGKLIYSTCTFSPEEDCEIVSYLTSLGYKVLPIKEEFYKFGEKGFIDNTLRIYPFNKGEGQFMAILEKTNENSGSFKKAKKIIDKDQKIVEKFIENNTTLKVSELNIVKYKNRYYLDILNVDNKNLNVKNLGVELGEVVKDRFEPFHHFYKALGKYFKNKVELSVLDPRVDHYLKGEEIICETPSGYGVIIIDNNVLGGFKATNNHLKNHYPKGLRNTKLYYED